MRRTLAAFALVAAACGTTAEESRLRPIGPYRPGGVREPAVFVRVASGPDLRGRAYLAFVEVYEAALVDRLDQRGVAVRDFRRLAPDEHLSPRAAIVRTRDVQASHAVIVDVGLVPQTDRLFCREARRPFRAFTAVLAQGVQVLRAADGAQLLTVDQGGPLDVMDLEADCANPRASRRREHAELVSAAADLLLARVFGR